VNRDLNINESLSEAKPSAEFKGATTCYFMDISRVCPGKAPAGHEPNYVGDSNQIGCFEITRHFEKHHLLRLASKSTRGKSFDSKQLAHTRIVY
jgi:hypothetical protein